MKLVFLDIKTIGEDIDLSAFNSLGEVVKYPFSSSEEVPERVKDADVVIFDQFPLELMAKAEAVFINGKKI